MSWKWSNRNVLVSFWVPTRHMHQWRGTQLQVSSTSFWSTCCISWSFSRLGTKLRTLHLAWPSSHLFWVKNTIEQHQFSPLKLCQRTGKGTLCLSQENKVNDEKSAKQDLKRWYHLRENGRRCNYLLTLCQSSLGDLRERSQVWCCVCTCHARLLPLCRFIRQQNHAPDVRGIARNLIDPVRSVLCALRRNFAFCCTENSEKHS